jgi:hypothetical protein
MRGSNPDMKFKIESVTRELEENFRPKPKRLTRNGAQVLMQANPNIIN